MEDGKPSPKNSPRVTHVTMKISQNGWLNLANIHQAGSRKKVGVFSKILKMLRVTCGLEIPDLTNEPESDDLDLPHTSDGECGAGDSSEIEVHVPADVGITETSDGECGAGDSSEIEVHVPADVGITEENENLMKIAALAANDIVNSGGDTGKSGDISDEWRRKFKSCAQIAGDNKHEMWARILRGEMESPGKFSKRAMSIMSDMNKNDADMFIVLAQFVTDDTPFSEGSLLIYDVLHAVYEKQRITYGELRQLKSLGLIDSWEGARSSTGSDVLLRYGDSYMIVKQAYDSKTNTFVMYEGKFSLTRAGREILSLTESHLNSEFLDYLVKTWNDMGMPVEFITKEVMEQSDLKKMKIPAALTRVKAR